MSNIPFLLSHIPYQPPAGTRVITAIADMVVIDFTPLTELTYTLGTDQQYNSTLIVKNTTINATLEVAIEFNDNLLGINTNNTISPYVFKVTSGQQISLPVQLKTSFLDAQSNPMPITALIKFTVKNLPNGTVVLRNV